MQSGLKTNDRKGSATAVSTNSVLGSQIHFVCVQQVNRPNNNNNRTNPTVAEKNKQQEKLFSSQAGLYTAGNTYAWQLGSALISL